MSSARLVWLGQSGFLIELAGANVLVDAFLAPHPDRQVVSELPSGAAGSLDVIACTHEHLDHLDKDCLPHLATSSPGASIVVPAPVVQVVTALGIPGERVIGLRPDSTVEIAGITIHAVPAMHGVHPADAYSFGDGRFVGFVFQAESISIYHAGDTILYDGLAVRLRGLHVGLALLPINGRDAKREALDIVGNLDAEEAAALAIEANVDVVVPMHYDMFAANPGDPAQLASAVARAGGGVTVMVPARATPFTYSRP